MEDMSVSMSMSMAMPTTTTATATMSMPTSMSTSMAMDMIFYTSTTTPLYSRRWTPSSTSTYAATCLFLILLAVSFRCLLAFKSHSEALWVQKARRRRYVVVDDSDTYRDGDAVADVDADGIKDKRGSTATLTARGVDEKVRIVEANAVGAGATAMPWRLSVDLPRALLYAVIVGVGYLEMLAVMTMNIGYFASVIAGAFLGELFVGRYAAHLDTHH